MIKEAFNSVETAMRALINEGNGRSCVKMIDFHRKGHATVRLQECSGKIDARGGIGQGDTFSFERLLKASLEDAKLDQNIN